MPVGSWKLNLAGFMKAKLIKLLLGITVLFVTQSNALSTENYLLFSGEVASRKTQVVRVPFVDFNSKRIVVMARDGERVNEGDIVVKFDQSSESSDKRRIEKEKVLGRIKHDKAKLESELQISEKEFDVYAAEQDFLVADFERKASLGVTSKIGQEELEIKAKEEFLKTTRLKKELSILKDEFLNLKALYKQKQMLLQEEELVLNEIIDGLTVKAVFSGVFRRSNISYTDQSTGVGKTVFSGSKVGEVVSQEQMFVKFEVPEKLLPSICENSQVNVNIDAFPDMVSLKGKIENIEDNFDVKKEFSHKAYKIANVIIEDKYSDFSLIAGMNVRVEVFVCNI